jgi:hypothetical protein
MKIPEHEHLGEDVCGFNCPFRDNKLLYNTGSCCILGWDGNNDESNDGEIPTNKCIPGLEIEFYLQNRSKER